MTDNPKKDEYVHPEEDFDSAQPAEESVSEDFSDDASVVSHRKKIAIPPILKNKKVWVPVVLVFAIYAAYWFMTIADKKQADIVQKPSPTLETPAQPVQTNASSRVADDLALDSELRAFSEKNTRNEAALSSLAEEMEQIQVTQSQINAELAGLHEAFETLSTKVDTLQQALSAPKKQVRKSTPPMPAKPIVHYHLKSVVPGRAWLESSKGTTLTVRVGDKLQGHGIVKKIDVTQGVVITSLGQRITYGRYDS